MAWKSRGKVPAAIEITCALMECLLADPSSFLNQAGVVTLVNTASSSIESMNSMDNTNSNNNSNHSNSFTSSLKNQQSSFQDATLRYMYASSFIRFINGIVDIEQKGSYARSVR